MISSYTIVIESCIEESDSRNVHKNREVNQIVHIITGLGDGGAEAVLYRMVISNQLPEEHIVISLLEKSKYGDPLENNNIRVYYMDMGLKLNIFLKLYDLYLLLKHLKPDVIQTWMYHSDFLEEFWVDCQDAKILFGVFTAQILLLKAQSTPLSS